MSSGLLNLRLQQLHIQKNKLSVFQEHSPDISKAVIKNYFKSFSGKYSGKCGNDCGKISEKISLGGQHAFAEISKKSSEMQHTGLNKDNSLVIVTSLDSVV